MSILVCRYGCEDDECDFGGEAKNGVALAARHAKALGHDAWAEPSYRHTFPAGGEDDGDGEGGEE